MIGGCHIGVNPHQFVKAHAGAGKHLANRLEAEFCLCLRRLRDAIFKRDAKLAGTKEQAGSRRHFDGEAIMRKGRTDAGWRVVGEHRRRLVSRMNGRKALCCRSWRKSGLAEMASSCCFAEMGHGFAQIPMTESYVLRQARVPRAIVTTALPAQDDLVSADLVISNGRVEGVLAPDTAPATLPAFDMRQGILFPGFVDMHTHLDKGHIWPRRRNPDGTFQGALENVKIDRKAHWTREDVWARMNFSLRAAYAHGTVAIRTHIDSAFGQEDISWPLVSELRAEWAGRIELQFSSLASADLLAEPAFAKKITALVVKSGGILGCVSYRTPQLKMALDNVFALASEHHLDLDFHVDETQDPQSRSLEAIADKALQSQFKGQIVVGHCCSLTRQPLEEQIATIAKLKAAQIGVVSLPLCNLYLQERQVGVTPRYRGATLVHELNAAGIPVAMASDNTRDPFYAYGDLDALEVYREATRILHLDHPVGDWPRTVTATPAGLMGLKQFGKVAIGQAADLVLFRARSWTELLARPQSDRTVLRAGLPIDTTLPDYCDLDPFVGPPA